MKISEILKIIVEECRNGCTDAGQTYHYFRKYHYLGNDSLSAEDLARVGALVRVLNFPALREHDVELLELIKADTPHRNTAEAWPFPNLDKDSRPAPIVGAWPFSSVNSGAIDRAFQTKVKPHYDALVEAVKSIDGKSTIAEVRKAFNPIVDAVKGVQRTPLKASVPQAVPSVTTSRVTTDAVSRFGNQYYMSLTPHVPQLNRVNLYVNLRKRFARDGGLTQPIGQFKIKEMMKIDNDRVRIEIGTEKKGWEFFLSKSQPSWIDFKQGNAPLSSSKLLTLKEAVELYFA